MYEVVTGILDGCVGVLWFGITFVSHFILAVGMLSTATFEKYFCSHKTIRNAIADFYVLFDLIVLSSNIFSFFNAVCPRKLHNFHRLFR